jgi:hypothetical protein
MARSKKALMALWTQAGGDPTKAGTAADIALAESSGRDTAMNSRRSSPSPGRGANGHDEQDGRRCVDNSAG